MDYQKKNYNVNYGLLLRYLISGIAGGTTQIATLYIWVSVLGMQTYYLWGVALGFCLAAIVGFFLQKYWTFAHRNQQHLPHWQFALYVLIALGGLCLLIEHFDDPTAVAREHYKALAPGGAALISVPYTYSYHAAWYYGTRPRMLRSLWPWTGVEQRFFTHQELFSVGKAITPHTRVFLLQPFLLGLIFLEMRKPK